MPIIGLQDRGMDFPQIGNLRKGAPKGANGQMGRELPYWRAEFDESETEAMQLFTQKYGDKPTTIDVILPFKRVDDNLIAWLEAYTASMMIGRSDGERVNYLVATKGDRSGEIVVNNYMPEFLHPPDNVAGWDQSGKAIYFTPVMRLKVVLPILKNRAAHLVVHSGSKLDIVNLTKQLKFYFELCGGSLQGVPFLLKRVPKMVSVPNPKKPGTKMRVKKHLITLELHPRWFEMKQAQLQANAYPALDSGPLALETELEEEDEELFIDGEITELSSDPIPPQPVQPEQVEELVEKIEEMMEENNQPPPPPTAFDKTDLPGKRGMEKDKRPYDPYSVKVRLAKKMKGQEVKFDTPTKVMANGLLGAFAAILGMDRKDATLQAYIERTLSYVVGKAKIEELNNVEYDAVRNIWMEANWDGNAWQFHKDVKKEIEDIVRLVSEEESRAA